METEKSPAEMLEALRDIFAKDLSAQPARQRREPIADPLLWRALQSQRKCGGDLLLGALMNKQ